MITGCNNLWYRAKDLWYYVAQVRLYGNYNSHMDIVRLFFGIV